MTDIVGVYTDYDTTYLSELAHGTLGAHDAEHCIFTMNGYTVTFTGSDFTYQNGHPSGGTLTGITVEDSAGRLTTWSDFSASMSSFWNAVANGDIATFNNLLYSGNDTFTAIAHDSGYFSGWGGNDVFNMQASNGADSVAGGDGNDTINYGANFSGFAAIDGGAGSDTLKLDGDYQSYTTFGYMTNVETIALGTGHTYADLGLSPTTAVTVDATALGAGNFVKVDGLWVNSGPLTLNGGAGNDTLISGKGNDVFNGGAGSDTVDYSHATSGVTVNLSLTTAQNVGGGAGSDTLNSVENVTGSGFADHLTGNSGDNLFFGEGGNDIIDGGAGNDTASYQDAEAGLAFDMRNGGSVGGDTLTSIESIVGTQFGDSFIGNSEDNHFDAGGCLNAAYDSISYQYSTGGMTLTETTYAGFHASFTAVGGDQGTDTLVDFTKIVGSSSDDTIYFLGFNFDYGGAGGPAFDGGSGTDTISFQNATEGLTAYLGNHGQYSASFTSVEVMIGSNYDDTLWGSLNNDTIRGGGGNDTIYGGPYGSSNDGDDTLDGGAGNDTLYGGDGNDRASYQGATSGVTVSLEISGIQNVGGGMGRDTLDSIESLSGSSFDDVLTGSTGNNVLGGSDGNDLLIGEAGDDTLDGGTGSDTASYADATSAVTVDLSNSGAQNVGGGAGSDTLVSIENVQGSAYGDTLKDNAGNNILDGQGGNDVLSATQGGKDILLGGNGNDSIVMGAALTGTDTIDGGTGVDTVTLDGDYSAGLVFLSTTIVNIESIALTKGHSYNLTTKDANVASGQKLTIDGSHLLVGDVLTFNGGGEKDGAFIILGGQGNDVLTGGSGDDSFDLSYGGNDSALGGGGNDTFHMGGSFTAADRIDGGKGHNTLVLNGDYSAGLAITGAMLANVATLSLGKNHTYTLSADDSVIVGKNTFTVDASALTSSDHFVFNGAAESAGRFIILGGAGVNVLTGGKGNDQIDGGASADVLTGGGGHDLLNGHGGGDTFVYGAVTDSTGAGHDIITGFDALTDHFDLASTVDAVDAAFSGGRLRLDHFDHDLARAVDSTKLAADHAVLFTPDSGSLAGHTFLIVDANGVAGYQAGQDLVIQLEDASNLASLSTGNFI
jgi:Ca2+-binding RTX toxin-like protein